MNTFEQWWEEWKKSHALLIDGQSIEAMEILAKDAYLFGIKNMRKEEKNVSLGNA
jgi:hypothetical protein